MYPFERFSEDAKAVLTHAQREAESSHQGYIGTQHLLLGVMASNTSVGARVLKELGINEARLRKDIDAAGTDSQRIIQQIVPTSRVKRVIEISFEEARRDGATYVGTEHILLALLVEGDDLAGKLLTAQGVTLAKTRAVIDLVRGAGARDQVREDARQREVGASAPPTMTDYPSERFSAGAIEALALAMQESVRAHHSYLGTEHLLLGLMQQDGLAGTALKALGIQIGVIRNMIENVLGRNERIIIQHIIPTSRVRAIIRIAVDDAAKESNAYATTGHLLVALLTEGQGIGAHVLSDLGVTPAGAKQEIERLRQSGIDEPGA